MAIYLGLGSNEGNRRAHLERALKAVADEGVAILRVSPIVESPALLPDHALPDWNLPFLNLVAECRYSGEPGTLLGCLKTIETRLGRHDTRRWSPRPIDIDILLWNDEVLDEPDLRVPHPRLSERAFVLSPLAALRPGLRLPGKTSETALSRARTARGHIPLWMGILNLTPDSFSDGGTLLTWKDVELQAERMWDGGAHILDLGAESTRPGAEPLGWTEELARLEPILERLLDKYSGRWIRPQLSVDTYHPEVAEKAIALGADLINDVGGLSTPRMIEIAAESGIDWVAMHHVSIPADPARTLATDRSAVDQVEGWLGSHLELWSRAGIDPERVIFDPGIGFGKNQLQSLDLLRHIDRFQRYGLRVLVGHSRKSFMRGFAGRDNHARDLGTIGASLQLCARHVDILRVHNVPDHLAAWRGWSHLAGVV